MARVSTNSPQKALSERGIDKMLKEVRDDNKENDAEHMRPVSSISRPFQTKADESHRGGKVP